MLGLLDDMDKNRFTIFQSLTLLRQLVAGCLAGGRRVRARAQQPSSTLLVEQLEDVIAEGHRALIFSQFTSFLAGRERLEAGNPVRLSGRSDAQARRGHRVSSSPATPRCS